MDGSGDTTRRAMCSSPGDGVAAATINRSFTTSTDTKPTPTPFPHSRASGVWPDREAAARRPGLRHIFIAVPHGSPSRTLPNGVLGNGVRARPASDSDEDWEPSA
uniref:Uncharacterized protein n=2 Tax=Oryza sativa subsp. japonica TaxID=39947 RepID=Q6ZCL5_ORYSJ|nr:hypothetical protein [Oryza sativa Japonica Group]BAD10422.1 hypothetical protein [Oryza sativa Japonica Group]